MQIYNERDEFPEALQFRVYTLALFVNDNPRILAPRPAAACEWLDSIRDSLAAEVNSLLAS